MLFPPIINGKIEEIYPWTGFWHDHADCVRYLFKKILPLKNVDRKNDSTIHKYFGSSRVYLLDSGRSSILLALKVLGIKAQDEVILTAFNCPAVVEPILYTKGVPRFIDINPTCGIDFDLLKKSINCRTRGIIVTHTFGLIDDLDNLSRLCRERNIFLINDLSQTLENTLSDIKLNRYGDISVYSFGPEKQLFALGGGAMVVNREDLLKKAEINLPEDFVSFSSILMTFARRWKYYFSFFIYVSFSELLSFFILTGLVYNFGKEKNIKIDQGNTSIKNMNSFQKSILARKLLEHKNNIEATLDNFIYIKNNLRFTLLSAEKMLPLYATMILSEGERFDVSEYLSKNGVQTVWNYLPLYKSSDISVDPNSLPNTEQMWKRVLSIPFRYPINKKRIKEICRIINSYDKNEDHRN